jgi:hypothetical protein
VIAAEVLDLAEHARRLLDSGSYCPETCGRCQHPILHVHDRRERGDGHGGVVVLMRFLCVSCLATWRVVPGFLARYLRRPWAEVEAVTIGRGPTEAPRPGTPAVPARTARRWRARLAAVATELLRRLGTSAPGPLPAQATCRDLVVAWADAHALAPGRRLADLAAFLHDRCPGVRVM